MRWSAAKYMIPLLVFIAAARSFSTTGFWVWLPVIYAFVFIPLIEIFWKPDESNPDAAEEAFLKNDRAFDVLLYLVVPLQYLLLFQFLLSMQDAGLSTANLVGRVLTMGLLCGIFGINVAHELGHRRSNFERLCAKSLLLTSMYMHFYIEHNRGHHKYVGTPQDPSSAPFNQSLYRFWWRSITGVYRKAWSISLAEQKKKGRAWYRNEMLHYQLVQVVFLALVAMVFGGFVAVCFLFAALIGILLLETVNYIEHYGLSRKETGGGSYERAMPEHSWNSNHILGRIMLFELSRHSDHHYLASKKYQTLRHHPDAPQLPAGYPGSMLLAMIPPIWFRIMNRRIERYRTDGLIGNAMPTPVEPY